MKKHLNIVFAIAVSVLFWTILSYDFYSSFAIGIFSYWLVSLILRANNSLPLKELFLSFYGLQYLFGAALTFNGFDYYNIEAYKMKISNVEYFTYTIPVFLTFSLGFNLFVKENGIKIDRFQINKWVNSKPHLPYYFILIGFISPLISDFIPTSLVFVSYLLESFKFVGLFILIMSFQKIKPVILMSIYGLILLSSFQVGMYHDLLTWLIVLGLILAYRYKPRWQLKFIAIALFSTFAIFIQSIKSSLREKTFDSNEKATLELVQNVNSENSSEKGGLFSKENLGPQINRVNQGWILASTIDNVPNNVQHTNGELIIEYLFSAIMPRILAPNKLNAGSQEVFNKFSGHFINSGTSMGLGLFADAYVEFGKYGALFYVFLFGLMYSYILLMFFKLSNRYPILILFSVLAFIYPMRPDCETQTVLGHIFKTIMLLTIIFYLFRKTFELPQTKSS